MSKTEGVDIELGITDDTQNSSSQEPRFFRRLSIVLTDRLVSSSRSLLEGIKVPRSLSWSSRCSTDTEKTLTPGQEGSLFEQREERQQSRIEDFPEGYPQFSAFMASHDCFQIFRRFAHVRSRLLLIEQAKISRLEKELNRLDKKDFDEGKDMFLSNSHYDGNVERKNLISELKEALASYDGQLTRAKHVAALPDPQTWNIKSVRNWLGNKAFIARDEIEFLDHQRDLATCQPENTITYPWLDQLTTIMMQHCSKKGSRELSRDPDVFILPRSRTELIGRIFLTPVTIVLLLTPVIACQYLNSVTSRLAVLIVAVAAFVTFLSVLSRAKTIELAVAGATYSTVLLVFIANPNTQS